MNGGKVFWKDDIIVFWYFYEIKIFLKVLNLDLLIIFWYENIYDYVGMFLYFVGNGLSCWILVSFKV